MNRDFKIKLGDPVVIVRKPEPVTCSYTQDALWIDWGFYQFPSIERTEEGYVHIRYSLAPDSALSYGAEDGHAISYDNGKTWQTCGKDQNFLAGLPLPGGGRIRLADLPALDAKPMHLPAPDDPGTERFRFYAESRFHGQFCTWPIERMLPGDDQWTVEYKEIATPEGIARTLTEGVVPYHMFTRLKIDKQNRVWAMAYPFYLRDYNDRSVCRAAFFRSEDNGETFRCLSTIRYQPDPRFDDSFSPHPIGFTEPEIEFLPNGTIVCLLRTHELQPPTPTYICHSFDDGLTWTKPEVFDKLGVWPNMLHLECGVTLATYGRPGVFLRASGDPDAKEWQEPITIVDGPAPCSYTGMIPVDDHTALMVYSDFLYPDEEGIPHKTILCRTVTVEE